MKVYKVLDDKGGAIYGRGKWPLPSDKGPGEWLEHKGKLIPCRSGLHLCRRSDLPQWLGPTIYLAEYEGEKVNDSDKIVVRKARLVKQLPWNDCTARLFAADCAERAVKKHIPNPDPRTLAAIEVTRKFARGEATGAERAAAWGAAWDAARDAALDDARAAAWGAAWDAAWDDARAAARAAAWGAAWDAARDAAWDDARAAAWGAAWDAERKWQTRRLFEYLDGKRS